MPQYHEDHGLVKSSPSWPWLVLLKLPVLQSVLILMFLLEKFLKHNEAHSLEQGIWGMDNLLMQLDRRRSKMLPRHPVIQ